MSQFGIRQLSGQKFDLTWTGITATLSGTGSSSFSRRGDISKTRADGVDIAANVTGDMEEISGEFIVTGADASTVAGLALVEPYGVMTVSNAKIDDMNGTYNCVSCSVSMSDEAAKVSLTMERVSGGSALALVS